MKHYEDYGQPTHEHEEMVLQSLVVANEILKKGYISWFEVTYTGKNKATIEVYLTGKIGSKKRPLLPFNLDIGKAKDLELIENAFDTIELDVARKIVSIQDNYFNKGGEMTVKRRKLHKFVADGIYDRFDVIWKK